MISQLPSDKRNIIINNIINNSNNITLSLNEYKNIKEKTSYQNLSQRYFSPNFSRVNPIIPNNSKILKTVNKNIKFKKYNNININTNNIEDNNKNYEDIIFDESRFYDLRLIREPNNMTINKNNDDIPNNEIKRHHKLYSYRTAIYKPQIYNNKTYTKKNLFPEPISEYKTSNINISEPNNIIMKIKTYNSPISNKIIKKNENIYYSINRNNNNLLKYNPILHHHNLDIGNSFDINTVLNSEKIKRKINYYKINKNNINNGLLGNKSYSNNIEKKFNLRKGKMNKNVSNNISHLNIAKPKQNIFKRIFKSKYC